MQLASLVRAVRARLRPWVGVRIFASPAEEHEPTRELEDLSNRLIDEFRRVTDENAALREQRRLLEEQNQHLRERVRELESG